MCRPNNQQNIKAASAAYRGTCGESHTAGTFNFAPAFRNTATGEVELARFADGRLAPMHLICGLPKAWATRLDAKGQVLELLDTIEAGFWRDNRFYTRDEARAAKSG